MWWKLKRRAHKQKGAMHLGDSSENRKSHCTSKSHVSTHPNCSHLVRRSSGLKQAKASNVNYFLTSVVSFSTDSHSNILASLCDLSIVDGHQCVQIWQFFTTLVIFYMFLSCFESWFCIWLNVEPTFAIFMRLGKLLLL